MRRRSLDEEDRAFVRSAFLNPEASPDWERYPFNLPAVRALRAPLKLDPRVTFLAGERDR